MELGERMYVSRYAIVKGITMHGTIILGPSRIDEGTFLDVHVIVGYPSRESLKQFLDLGNSPIEKLDRISKGSIIGKNCIVRSGTVIYEDVKIGDFVEMGHNVLIRSGSTIGDSTLIGTGSQLDGAVKVGKNVRIESMVYLPHRTEIGDNVFIGPGVKLINDLYPPSKRLIGVKIENDACIGSGAILLAGITIGEGSVVAAGSIVTKDVPPNTVVIGAPAKIHGSKEEYLRKKSLYESLGSYRS